MLDAAVKSARLETLLDAVLSVEEVGVYKPDPRVYQLAVDRLGVPASAISFQSSNGWDAYAASAFGMKVVWCNRYGQRRERLPGAPDFGGAWVSGLPAIVGACWAGSPTMHAFQAGGSRGERRPGRATAQCADDGPTPPAARRSGAAGRLAEHTI